MPQSGDRLFATPRIERRNLSEGAYVLRSSEALGAYPDTLCYHLDRWAAEEPNRTFLAARASDGTWRVISYAAARRKALAVAGHLLDRGLTPTSPVMVLSDNSIDSAVLQFGCFYAGIPFAPVSPAYSLMSRDFAKLKYIGALLEPGLIFAADGHLFAAAFNALRNAELNSGAVEFVVSRNAPDGFETTGFAAFTDAGSDAKAAAVETAYARVGPDTNAKILFTSGSTGLPKGVINTHRMMCSNQQAIAQMWPFLERRPPVIVDWLPWNHTFGGNHNFNLILRNGGTLYIDSGKPAPGLVEQTIENLRQIAPSLYFNVPRGFDMILPALEADPSFRDHFFSNLDLIFYAAAALPQSTWERLEKQAIAARGEKIIMTSAWGATETAPLATSAHLPLDRAGIIGVPAPGTEIKMVPNGDKHEMRVRGPNVTPGYYRRDDLTQEAFDADGFYCIGDAGRLADEGEPSKGIVFDGRVAEDFKLLTGTWVSVGSVRVSAVTAAAPIIQDAVVTGHDRNEIGLLIFPNPAVCAAIAGEDPATPLDQLVGNFVVREKLIAGLTEYNSRSMGSNSRIARVILMTEPASIDANEITDKGYINQRAVLDRRADLVERLYSGTDETDVMILL